MNSEHELLDAEGRANLEALAERLDLAERCQEFKPLIWDGSELPRPVLHVEDFTGIPFLLGVSGVEEYQHRARCRVLADEMYTAVTPVPGGYEEYCEARLGLPPTEFIPVDPSGPPLAISEALSAPGPGRARLIERAREAGGLQIHPFMGIESVWELAAGIGEEAGVPVVVIAPPPPVTWLANDKENFFALVRALLGDDFLVECTASQDPRRLAEALLDLARRHPRVGLKRLRCASAMGNEVHDARELLEQGPQATEARVRAFLERTEWPGDEQVQAVAWEETEQSPSTQLWIPPLGAGAPRLDGIYDQILEGPEKIFIGSRPSRLPKPVHEALSRAALRLAAGLQAAGYRGRCSMDFLVLGDPAGEFRVCLTECNGRWGGTSTPMKLIDRTLGRPWPPYRAQDVEHPDLIGVGLPEILERVGDEAYDVHTGRGHFLFYNVGPLARTGKLDVISIGRTQEEAEAGLEEQLPRLLGISRRTESG